MPSSETPGPQSWHIYVKALTLAVTCKHDPEPNIELSNNYQENSI